MRRAKHILILTLAVLLIPASANAGPPGEWTEFTSHKTYNFEYHGYQRTSDGVLHVVWNNPQDDGNFSQGFWHTDFNTDGTIGSTDQVVAGNTGEGDLVLNSNGTLRTFFGALLEDPEHQNLNTATAPASGAPWTLGPGDIASGGAAYAAPIAAAVGLDGTFYQSWGYYVHRGLSDSAPNQDYQTPFGCCAYDPQLAVDQQTGQVYRLWYSNGSAQSGLLIQEVNPSNAAPKGTAMDVPGVEENGDSAQMTGNPQITSIPGQAGVYVAYHGGYPFTDRVVVWKVGDAEPTILANKDQANYEVAMAAAPDGRLWVLWGTSGGDHDSDLIFFRVSDTSRTSWSPTLSIQRPPDGGDFHTLWSLAADAQSDRVDVFAHINVGAGGQSSYDSTWHTQIMMPVTGGDEDDNLQGTSADEVFLGGDGNDTIDGGGGNDIIVGGNGNDVMTGGPGKDKIAGGAGEDRIVGDAKKSPQASARRSLSGTHMQTTEPTADRLSGGGGDDTVLGQAGNDQLKGDAGNDLLKGGDGVNNFNGGAGTDTCVLDNKRDNTRSCEHLKRNFKRNFLPTKPPA